MILTFWPKIIFWAENKINEHQHSIYYIWISLCTKFQLKQTILIFGQKWSKTGILGPKQKKWYHDQNQHIRIRLNGKFHLKTDNFDFLDKSCTKRVLPIQTRTNKDPVIGQISITFKCRIFELFYITSFNMKRQFWLFEPNLTYFQSKTGQIKWPSSSTYPN